MEQYLYNSYKQFFNTLNKLGYVKDKTVYSLLIMSFIHRLIYEDYRGIICEKDYHIIEKAINCLYGTSCLLPYRDYLKMGKLHIGEYTELAHKLCNLDKYSHEADKELQDRATSLETRATSLEGRADVLESRATFVENRATRLETRATNLENRATTLENRADNTDIWIRNEEDKDMTRDYKIANLEGHTKALQQQADSNTSRISVLESTKAIKSNKDIVVVDDIQL